MQARISLERQDQEPDSEWGWLDERLRMLKEAAQSRKGSKWEGADYFIPAPGLWHALKLVEHGVIPNQHNFAQYLQANGISRHHQTAGDVWVYKVENFGLSELPHTHTEE